MTQNELEDIILDVDFGKKWLKEEGVNFRIKLIEMLDTLNVDIVENQHSWIPCCLKLPEEPDDENELNYKEYLVTIRNADISTTLYYLGDGIWEDSDAQRYNVIAWAEMPEIYKKIKRFDETIKKSIMHHFIEIY